MYTKEIESLKNLHCHIGLYVIKSLVRTARINLDVTNWLMCSLYGDKDTVTHFLTLSKQLIQNLISHSYQLVIKDYT